MIKKIEFDWDEGNREKCKKHGISISEIEMVMKSTPIISPDPMHSQAEERYIAIGRTLAVHMRGGLYISPSLSA